jgi:hypothetical protein
MSSDILYLRILCVNANTFADSGLLCGAANPGCRRLSAGSLRPAIRRFLPPARDAPEGTVCRSRERASFPAKSRPENHCAESVGCGEFPERRRRAIGNAWRRTLESEAELQSGTAKRDRKRELKAPPMITRFDSLSASPSRKRMTSVPCHRLLERKALAKSYFAWQGVGKGAPLAVESSQPATARDSPLAIAAGLPFRALQARCLLWLATNTA